MYPLFGMFIGAVVQNIYILAKESIKNKRHWTRIIAKFFINIDRTQYRNEFINQFKMKL
jgi:hypothetical protein